MDVDIEAKNSELALGASNICCLEELGTYQYQEVLATLLHLCDIPTQGLIGLIGYSYQQVTIFFSGSRSAKNSEVKRAWPGAISGWLTDREVFPGCARVKIKCAEKTVGL